MTDREAMKLALETLEGIANSNWRKWEELASPEEFERWVKSRANHSAEALRQALEQHILADSIRPKGKSITKVWVDELRGGDENLEEPPNSTTDVEEPVVWVNAENLQGLTLGYFGCVEIYTDETQGRIRLYTAPPKREWVGLTDEEIAEGAKQSWVDKQAFESAVWWAEAKLRDKNGF